MKPNIKLDRFLNSTTLSTSIFITSGCYRTYQDYKNATPKYKDKFLVKDSLVLSGAAFGILAHQAAANKIVNTKIYNSVIHRLASKLTQVELKQGLQTSIKYSTDIIKDLSRGFFSSASGIIGALGMDYLYSKANKDELKYSARNNTGQQVITHYVDGNLAKFTDKTTRDALYSSVTDIPVISTGMLGYSALDIAKDKEFNARFKHTTGYLINDTLIPLTFLSIANVLTRNMKTLYRIPTIFGSLFAGTLGLRKVMDNHLMSFNIPVQKAPTE